MFAGANVNHEINFFILHGVPGKAEYMMSGDLGDGDSVPGKALAFPRAALRAVGVNVSEVSKDDELGFRHGANVGDGHGLKANPVASGVSGFQDIAITGGDDG